MFICATRYSVESCMPSWFFSVCAWFWFWFWFVCLTVVLLVWDLLGGCKQPPSHYQCGDYWARCARKVNCREGSFRRYGLDAPLQCMRAQKSHNTLTHRHTHDRTHKHTHTLNVCVRWSGWWVSRHCDSEQSNPTNIFIRASEHAIVLHSFPLLQLPLSLNTCSHWKWAGF